MGAVEKLADEWLSMPRIRHPRPSGRFPDNPRWESDARMWARPLWCRAHKNERPYCEGHTPPRLGSDISCDGIRGAQRGVNFGATVQAEIEDIGADLDAAIEVAGMDDEFVVEGAGHRDDLPSGRDDAALTDEVASLLLARFGDANDPHAVLIGARLHREVVVEALQMIVFGGGGIVHRRIVADQNHFRVAERQLPICFWPAAVVANRLADFAAESVDRGKGLHAGVEIALLEVLERPPGLVLFVSRKMNLAVAMDDLSGSVDQD